MNVRTKFRVDSVVKATDGAPVSASVTLRSATPFGEIRMNITAPADIESFKVGNEYYVDFSKA